MGRQPCWEKIGPWTWEEDQKLMNFILNNGIQCWRLVRSGACRFDEMWEKLQTEVDKLLEARPQERCIYRTRGGYDNRAPFATG